VTLSSQDIEFLSNHNSAAMITTGNDGRPKVARVGVALIDGKLWSSGTEGRTRTRRLRRDPRCTVFVFDTGWNWLTLDTTVRILDGPDAPELNMRLFRTMQNRPTGSLNWFGREYEPEEFLQVLVDEQRIIYEFEVERAYGMR
jgi:PPOX class probable F420-dependent enzyme